MPHKSGEYKQDNEEFNEREGLAPCSCMTSLYCPLWYLPLHEIQ